MKFAFQLLSKRIIGRNLYLDKCSFNKYTQETKPKYKIAHSKVLEDFIFHVLTKRKSSCKRRVTLTIRRGEWENLSSDEYLKEECSYCDASKYDLINEDDLIYKIKDKNNGFPHIAQMPLNMYAKLLKLCKEVNYIPTVSAEAKEIIGALPNILDETLQKIGLD